MNYAIIAAAGISVRMKGIDKTFVKILNQPAIYWTLLPFENHPLISGMVIVTGKQDQKKFKELSPRAGFRKIIAIVEGGSTRQESVYHGLCEGQKLGWRKKDLVLIQDGARILITKKEITPAISAAKRWGAAVVGVPVKDTIHRVDKETFLQETPPRETLFAAQTPQVLRFNLALTAFAKAQKEGRLFTDDVSLAKYYSPQLKVKITPGSYENLKITTPQDLRIVEGILKGRK